MFEELDNIIIRMCDREQLDNALMYFKDQSNVSFFSVIATHDTMFFGFCTFFPFFSVELDSGKLRYLTLTDSARVWMPDLFFSNEKQGHLHNIIMPNVYIRIHPDGEVLYSIR